MNSGYPDLSYQAIHKEYIYCVIPRSTPQGSSFGPDEATVLRPALVDNDFLKDLNFLVPLPSNGLYNFTNQLMQQYQLTPTATLAMNNLDTAYKLAAQGCGALFINAFDFHCWHPALDAKLAFCILSNPPVCRHAMLCYRQDSKNIDLIESLRTVIDERLLPMLSASQPNFE